ncbi:hypothetical protein LSUE1_G008223, partial [Lachnellula suecica]
ASSTSPSLTSLIPVLTSTASVTFCFTEYWTLLPFLHPSIPPQSLSAFWDSYLYRTMPGWLGFGLTSAVTGYLSFRSTAGVTRQLYGWGTVLALGHYAFGPSVAKIIERMIKGPPENAKGELRTWLKLHTVRTLLVDIPAMACFVGAFVHLI